MKAILLAAGRGERLKPLTDTVPKCLVKIGGRPLLQYWLDICEHSGFESVLVNGFYLADQVENFLTSIVDQYKMKIEFVRENRLHGTGGTVLKHRKFVEGDDFFMFCHADNFTDIRMNSFIEFHRNCGAELSVALFRTSVPKQCGIAEEIADDGRILRFVEKPNEAKTDLASAAVFLASPTVFDAFPEKEIIDFSKEVLPKFQGQMYGFPIDGFNIDVGTPDNYRLANRKSTEWSLS